MTEAEWLACCDPAPMLEQLGNSGSDRKVRLFACACVRRIDFLIGWALEVRQDDYRRALTVSERFADGTATREELAEARDAADDSVFVNSDLDYSGLDYS